MKHEYLKFDDEALVVEQFFGVVNAEDIIRTDNEVFSSFRSMIDKGHTCYKLLSDISNAYFDNLKYDQLGQINASIERQLEGLPAGVKLKLALFSGENHKDDFLKASQYTRFETERLTIKNFLDIRDALNWLELDSSTRTKIWELVND